MEQQVQYCTTSDGVRIAYASVGEGRPLIVVPGWVTHLHYAWAEEAQAFWKQLARHRRVVQYDGRG
ncbi:MAG: transcriptional regulator, partial [Chloroflexi bacterium]|nr:transcriptional regulator [Chloroflexota bacterium]